LKQVIDRAFENNYYRDCHKNDEHLLASM